MEPPMSNIQARYKLNDKHYQKYHDHLQLKTLRTFLSHTKKNQTTGIKQKLSILRNLRHIKAKNKSNLARTAQVTASHPFELILNAFIH